MGGRTLLTVRYDGERDVAYDFGLLDELTLAYAISVHKAQGAEYPCVVLPLLMQHYALLQRNLLYTAVTRAKQFGGVSGRSARHRDCRGEYHRG